jgi:hypothetical protein
VNREIERARHAGPAAGAVEWLFFAAASLLAVAHVFAVGS